MKLVDSLVEGEYRRELKEGARYLLEEGGDPKLLALLCREVGAVESVYYLAGYKLSDYRTYSLLVNGTTVCHIEISNEQIEAFNMISISEYKKGLKKKDQIKLQVALELSRACGPRSSPAQGS